MRSRPLLRPRFVLTDVRPVHQPSAAVGRDMKRILLGLVAAALLARRRRGEE